MIDYPYALVPMAFQGGRWVPASTATILYGETISDAMEFEDPEKGAVYGAWYMTPEDHREDRAEEKISTSRPQFMVAPVSGKRCLVAKDGQLSVERTPETRQMYVATGLVFRNGVYLPDTDLWNVHLAGDAVSAVENCHGGADVRGTGFGVWKVDGTGTPTSVIKERLPDLLYLMGPEGALEKLPQTVIEQLVRVES